MGIAPIPQHRRNTITAKTQRNMAPTTNTQLKNHPEQNPVTHESYDSPRITLQRRKNTKHRPKPSKTHEPTHDISRTSHTNATNPRQTHKTPNNHVTSPKSQKRTREKTRELTCIRKLKKCTPNPPTIPTVPNPSTFEVQTKQQKKHMTNLTITKKLCRKTSDNPRKTYEKSQTPMKIHNI